MSAIQVLDVQGTSQGREQSESSNNEGDEEAAMDVDDVPFSLMSGDIDDELLLASSDNLKSNTSQDFLDQDADSGSQFSQNLEELRQEALRFKDRANSIDQPEEEKAADEEEQESNSSQPKLAEVVDAPAYLQLQQAKTVPTRRELDSIKEDADESDCSSIYGQRAPRKLRLSQK